MNPQHLSLSELFDQHGAAVRLYARQWCRHPDDALQEALLDLNQQITFPQDPVAWLYVAVKRRAINQARAETRRRNHQTIAAADRDAWFEVNPQSEIENTEAIESLEQSLTQLSELQREIVTARIWGELTFEQIAELVQKPPSTVHRIYQQTLQILQHLLQPQRQDHAPTRIE